MLVIQLSATWMSLTHNYASDTQFVQPNRLIADVASSCGSVFVHSALPAQFSKLSRNFKVVDFVRAQLSAESLVTVVFCLLI